MERIPVRDSPAGERLADSYASFFSSIFPKTAAYTVLQSESGALFTNRGASASVTFTLPAVKAGVFYVFAKAVVDQNIVIVTPTGVKVHGGVGATQGETVTNSTNTQYGTIMIWCDGTAWWCIGLLGTWAIT